MGSLLEAIAENETIRIMRRFEGCYRGSVEQIKTWETWLKAIEESTKHEAMILLHQAARNTELSGRLVDSLSIETETIHLNLYHQIGASSVYWTAINKETYKAANRRLTTARISLFQRLLLASDKTSSFREAVRTAFPTREEYVSTELERLDTEKERTIATALGDTDKLQNIDIVYANLRLDELEKAGITYS